MHLIKGHTATFNAPGLQVGETVVDISYSPKGNVFCVLTERQLQFWSGLQNIVQMCSLALPHCAVGDDTVESATKLIWHPQGRSLAIATTERRLIFVEADIIAGNVDAIAMHSERDEIAIGSASTRVCVSFDIQLDFGMIVNLSTSASTLLATTSAGFVLVIQWSSGKVLHALNAAFFLQQRIDNLPASVGGSVTYFTHNSKLQLSALILSDGSVCVLRSDESCDFSSAKLSFSGTCTPNVGAQLVELNAKHRLVVAACANVQLKFFSIAAPSLPLGSGSFTSAAQADGEGSAVQLSPFEAPSAGASSWCDRPEGLGSIRVLQWSNDEESLCVGFKHLGTAVFHYSGVCTMTSFQRFSFNERVHSTSQVVPSGVATASWDADSYRLLLASPASRGFTVCAFAKLASTAPPAEGQSGAIAMINPTSFSILHPTDAEGMSDNWETLSVPPEYIRENYPLRHCAVSSDGNHIVCAGAAGCVLYNRKMKRWRMFGMQRQERNVRVVTSPVWINNLCVVLPVRNNGKSRFELVAYPRFHLDEASALEVVVVDRRPDLVSCTRNFVAVIDAGQQLTIFEAETAADNLVAPRNVSLSLKKKYSVSLLPHYHNAISFAVCPLSKEQAAVVRPAQIPMVALLRRDHVLCTIDPNADGSSFDVIDEKVCSFWLDSTTVSTSGTLAVITFGLMGVRAHVVPLRGGISAAAAASSNGGTPTVDHARQRLQQQQLFGAPPQPPTHRSGRYVGHVADFDCEAIPLGTLALDGFVLFGAEGIDRRVCVPGLPPLFTISVKPVLYQHRVLLPLFINADADDGCSAARQAAIYCIVDKLRRHGCFVETLDYLLHTVIHEEPHAGFDRRRALHNIVKLLRKYPEYHEVVVGCVRKTDVAKWRPIFDVIGSPHDFFNECIEAGKLAEAAHVVRALLMDRMDDTKASLEAASQGARRLFAPVLLRQRDFHLAYELLRYITLLELEIDLPPVVVAETPLTGIEKALRTVWPLAGGNKKTPAPQGSSSGAAGSGGGSGGGSGSGALGASGQPPSMSRRVPGSMSGAAMSAIVAGAASAASSGSAAGGSVGPYKEGSPPGIGAPIAASRSLRQQNQRADDGDAVMAVLLRYPQELEQPLVDVGVEMLRAGRISQLCACFEVFDLDLSYFITSQWRRIVVARSPSPPNRDDSNGDLASSATSAQSRPNGSFKSASSGAAAVLDLNAIFDAIHLEFGLPRCASGEVRVPRSTESAADDDLRLLLSNSLKLCTATQEHLLVVRTTFHSLSSLLKLFAFHNCVEYALLLATLLIQVEVVRRVLSERHDLEQPWAALLMRPENLGYRRLLRTVLPDFSPAVPPPLAA